MLLLMRRVLPPADDLAKLVEQGYTHQQIADIVSRQTGENVSRSTVSAALWRSGKTSGPAKKYAAEIPWTVREEHQTHYAARMLRLLGRRRANVQNSAEADRRLDAWLAQLKSNGAVVVYVPDTEEGFFYVEGKADHAGVPIMAELPDIAAS